MSTFGTLFRVTTYGESHCASVGAIIDGCPPVSLLSQSMLLGDVALSESTANRADSRRVPTLQGMPLSDEDIQPQMTRRRPGQSVLTTPASSSQTLPSKGDAQSTDAVTAPTA